MKRNMEEFLDITLALCDTVQPDSGGIVMKASGTPAVVML